MTLQLVFRPSAEFDLEAIYDLIAADSPRAAHDFVEDIRRRCEPLSDFPRMGRSLDGRIHQITFDRKVRVNYAITEISVEVFQIRYLGQQS